MTKTDTLDGGPLPINLEHLSLYTANDPDITRDILRLFTDQMNLKLVAMTNAADLEAWRQEAHALKGSSLGVGAQELAELALAAEALTALEGSAYEQLLGQLEAAATRAGLYATQLLEDGSFAG